MKTRVRLRVRFFGSGDLMICACSCMAWLKLVISMARETIVRGMGEE